MVEPPPHRIANPTAVFSGLDKITGRIITFDVAINETVQFGALQVTPRVCYSRPPTETPNTDGFIEVDEVTLQGEIKRIFTGWMFAASPGLHAVEHPIYDVWLTDCKGATPPAVAEAPAEQPRRSPRAQPRARRSAAQPRPPQQPRRAAMRDSASAPRCGAVATQRRYRACADRQRLLAASSADRAAARRNRLRRRAPLPAACDSAAAAPRPRRTSSDDR